MNDRTRREFLAGTAVAGGAMALNSVAQPAPSDPPLAMSIARWKGAPVADEGLGKMATKLTEEVIAALGGMGRFVSKGNTVWVKPNMAWDRTPEQAANTNPDVVGTLVRLCFEAGAKTVRVGDNTCHKSTVSYPNSGIEAAAKAAGAEVVYLDKRRFRKMDLKGKVLQNWPVYPQMIESDVIINVPIVKHHSISTVTLCMKNLMGTAGGNRGTFHQDIGASLSDISAFVKPQLNVLDAIRILTAHGPQGGNMSDVKRMDTVAASTDIVALDAFGASLLGHVPDAIATVKAGYERGLGQMDYTKIPHREIEVA